MLIAGRLAEGTGLTEALLATGNAVSVPLDGGKEEYMPRFMAAFEKLYAAFAPVECRAEKVGIQRYDNGGKTWIHLLNYRYDEQEDRVLPMETLEFTVRNVSGKPEILVPAGDPVPACEVHRAGDNVKVILRNAGLYTVAVFGS